MQLLMIPGPTNMPREVLQALSLPAVGHRTPEFSEVIKEVTVSLKKIYHTKNDLFILTSSGTGAMEAAVANFVNQGDKVIVMENGNFGERWVKLNNSYGADVEIISGVWGEQADPEILKKRISADHGQEIKAVFVTHNETSTGVTNDLKALREALGEHPALFIVDAISGMAVSPLKVDEWNLDVVVSGSQKAFMIPPGLGFISVSPRAWAKSEQVTNPRFYFDLRAAAKSFEKSTTPYTPATCLILALRESLKLIEKEGLQNVYKRHQFYKQVIRTAAKALGLNLLTNEKSASCGVTAIKKPTAIDPQNIVKIMREKHGIIIAGGQNRLKGEIFRIGHLGYVSDNDLVVTIAALERTLLELGWSFQLGQGIQVVQELLQERMK